MRNDHEYANDITFGNNSTAHVCMINESKIIRTIASRREIPAILKAQQGRK